MTDTILNDYLASDENKLLSFSPMNIEEGNSPDNFDLADNTNSGSYEFAATDRRMAYTDTSGDFKDISYEHISSIETEEIESKDYGTEALLGCCGIIFALGGIALLSDGAAVGILILVISSIFFYAVQNRDNSEGEDDTKEKIKFITGDESHQQITITTPSNDDSSVSAELSRIIREQQ